MISLNHRRRGEADPAVAARSEAGSRASGEGSPAHRERLARRATARLAGVVALAAAASVLAGCGAGAGSSPVEPSAISRFDGMSAAGLSAPNFTLRDQYGQMVSLAGERGKFVVITFLYTHCTNVCPVIAEQLNQALRDLGPGARAQVRVLAVSVDPRGDTPAAVAHFIAVHRLLPQFLYLTGTEKTLAPIWASYHIASEQTPEGLVVGHTALEILLNRNGQPEAIYDSTVTPEQVIHDLGVLGLKE